MVHVLMLALATASISLGITMCRSLIGKLWAPLGAALGCPYLVSHFVALTLVLLTAKLEGTAWDIAMSTLIATAAVVTISAILMGLIKWAFEASAKGLCPAADVQNAA